MVPCLAVLLLYFGQCTYLYAVYVHASWVFGGELSSKFMSNAVEIDNNSVSVFGMGVQFWSA